MNKFILLLSGFIVCFSASPLMATGEAPERSWHIPQSISEIRKISPDKVPSQLVNAVELVDQARLIAGQDKNGMDYDNNYPQWRIADALFRQIEEKYASSDDIRLKRLVAYAMNKRSLLACRLAVPFDEEEWEEKTQKNWILS